MPRCSSCPPRWASIGAGSDSVASAVPLPRLRRMPTRSADHAATTASTTSRVRRARFSMTRRRTGRRACSHQRTGTAPAGSRWRRGPRHRRSRRRSRAVVAVAKVCTRSAISSVRRGRGSEVCSKPLLVKVWAPALAAVGATGASPSWNSVCETLPVCQSWATIVPPSACTASVTRASSRRPCSSEYRPGVSM